MATFNVWHVLIVLTVKMVVLLGIVYVKTFVVVTVMTMHVMKQTDVMEMIVLIPSTAVAAAQTTAIRRWTLVTKNHVLQSVPPVKATTTSVVGVLSVVIQTLVSACVIQAIRAVLIVMVANAQEKTRPVVV